MKKKLLLMLTLILAALPAFSQSSVTVQMSGMYPGRGSNLLSNIGDTKNYPVADGEISLDFTCNGAKGGWAWMVSSRIFAYFQMHSGSTMKVSMKEGNVVSKLVFTLNAANNKATAYDVTVNGEKCVFDGNTCTWEGTPAQSVELVANGAGTSYKFAFTEIQIFFKGDASGNIVPSPVISPAANEVYYNNLDVEITAGEGSPEDTKIYYTYKNLSSYNMSDAADDPTESSDEYTGTPISLTATNNPTWEVKAIAVAGGKKSEIVSYKYTLNRAETRDNIWQFLSSSAANPNSLYEITGECTVVYQNGQIMFVTDGNYGMYIANAPKDKYKEGDVITGIMGRYADFRGQNAMLAISGFNNAIRNESYEWTSASYTNLTNLYGDTNCYPYIVKTVYFDNKGGEDGVIGSLVFANGDKVALWNTNEIPTLGGNQTLSEEVVFPAEAGWYDVKGVTSKYESSDQFIPFSFVAATAEKTADPVFEPESGTYEVPFDVTVTSTTEGAVIRYTNDGNAPTMDSPILTDKLTIETDATIKAFAVAQGYLPSEVVEVVYSKKTGIESIDADAADAEYFDLLGRRVSNPANGLYIKRANGASTKVLVK